MQKSGLLSSYYAHNTLMTFGSVYKNGVAEGLYALAQRECKDEERAATKVERERLEKAAAAEKAQREAELARLRDPPPKKEEEVKPEVPVQAEDRKVRLEEVADVDAMPPPVSASPTYKDKPTDLPKVGSPHDDDTDSDNEQDDGSFLDDADPVDPGDFVDDDPVNDGMDLDDELRRAEEKVKSKRDPSPQLPPPPPPPPEPVVKKEDDDEPGAGWASAQQLVQFRQNAENIADQFLKERGKKLGKGRKRAPVQFKDETARKAYYQGQSSTSFLCFAF